MSFTRLARQPFLRPLTRSTPQVAFTSRRAAHQDYGSGAGSPAGENPKDQGKNPMEHKEHPGPAPPSTPGNSSGGSKQESSGDAQQKDGSGQQQAQRSSSKGTQGGAQPKILSESPPAESEQSEEVRAHNREVDRRAERSHEKVQDEDVEKDKVSKKFWSGHGGADKDP